jgi:ech hydrogenase subunit F
MSFFQMTKTVLKNLFTRPATLMYPVKPAKKTDATRGHVKIDPTKCITCRICQRKCPTQAICVDVKEKTWEIDQMRCVVCAVCVDTCPTKSLIMDNQYRPAMTARGGLEKFTVAGPKKKEPVAAEAAVKPAKE